MNEDNMRNMFQFQVYKNKCNMKLHSYSQPVLFGVARVAERFDLTYDEVVAVHLASVYVPECKVFFALACDIVATLTWEEIPTRYHSIYIGLLIAKLNVELLKIF